MKKLRNRGFAAMELILMLLIIAIIGGAGYYVYNSQKKTNDSLGSTASSGSTPQKTEKETSTSEEGVVGTHENTTLGISFTYPKDWTKKVQELDKTFKENVWISSPDYKEVPEDPFGAIETGGIFMVQVYATEYKNNDELKANDPYMSNPYDVKLGGISALRQDKCGHPVQRSVCVSLVKGGYEYNVSYAHPNAETSNSAKYIAEFKALLASFKFK